MDKDFKKQIGYCMQHTTPQSEVLYQLERETNLKTLAPQMLSGPFQGQLLRFLSFMIQPEAVLEIGTFTGYATICLSAGLQEGGVLHTIEANEELESIIRKYIRKSGLEDRIQLHIGNAKKIVPLLEETFDLVFIDAGKNDYAFFFDLVFDKVRPGGFILADNVLWSGKVVHQKKDKDTTAIDRFNKKLSEDPEIETIMLPIRDGILLARKKFPDE